jgi:hypothetical protein
MLGSLSHREQVWRLRYALVKDGLAQGEISEKRENIDNHLNILNRMLNIQQRYLTDLQARIGSLEKKLLEKDLAPQVGLHLKNQLSALRKLAERRFEYTSFLSDMALMDRRVLEEIDSKLKRVSLKQRLSTIRDYFKNIWGFELWVIENRPVTVRKLVVALFILIVGILIAKFIFRIVSKRLASYPYLKETTASVIQKMLSYFAYLLILIFALRIVNIPLAAFAFFGGAIAIGVGFGAQNLINNFISGFIMMAERPISIGDLIELEGILGKVEEIGARCTRVRTGENIHILVPNSSFLEKNINPSLMNEHDKLIERGPVIEHIHHFSPKSILLGQRHPFMSVDTV